MSAPKAAKKDDKGEKEAPKNSEVQKKADPKAKVQKTDADVKTKEALDAKVKDDASNKEPTNLADDQQSKKAGNTDKPEDHEKPCVEKKKRDILKLLEECVRGDDFAKRKKTEESCCTWHKYVFYALPLAAYLPWLFRMAKCPPKCCPPKYCCPCNCEPFCPPSKLACAPKVTGCPRLCKAEDDPCFDQKEPTCKESDKYSI